MKIAFVSTQLGWGGGENVLAQLMIGLQSKEVEVMLAAPCKSAMAAWAAKQERVSCLNLPGKGRNLKAMWKLRRWVKDNHVDVVLLNDPHSITYGGIALAGLKQTSLGVRHTCFPVRSSWKYHLLLDRVICVSQAAKKECMLAGIDDSRLEVIYNGLPAVDASESAKQVATKTLQPYQTQRDEKNLLAVGSLLPVKAFDTAIKALADAVKIGKRWHLWIAGEGPERDNLERLANELGVADRVHLLGFRDDVHALLTVADVFVSTSQNEGLSLVAIEAMQTGCPVVATPVGGCSEVLFADETIGEPVAWTFDPGDCVGLIVALTEALDSELVAKQRTDAAKRWVDKRFSLDQMTKSYLEVAKRQLAA